MRVVADAEQSFPAPFSQAINLNREQLDLVPIVELRDSIFQERSECDNVPMQGSQAAVLYLIEPAFWNNKSDLEIVAAIEKHEQLSVSKKAKRLRRVVLSLGNAHPKHVDWHTELA